MKFNVNPHHAFLNSHIQLSNNTSETIYITCKQLDKTWHLSPNQVIDIDNTCMKNAGKYDFSCVNNGETQCVVVEDAIRLGGSNFRKTFAFEKNPWFLVSMNDRTYFYNHITKEQYLENDIAPESVIGLNEKYLFLTNEKNTTYGALYSTIERKIVRYIGELIAYNEQYIVCQSDDYIEIIGINPQIVNAKIQVGKQKYVYYSEIHSIAHINNEQKCIVYNVISQSKSEYSVSISSDEKITFLEKPYFAKIGTYSILLVSLQSFQEKRIYTKSSIMKCNDVSLLKEDETPLDFYERQHSANSDTTSVLGVNLRCHDDNTVYLEKQYYCHTTIDERYGRLANGRHTLENAKDIILIDFGNEYIKFQYSDKYLIASSNSRTAFVNETTIFVQKDVHYFCLDGLGYYYIEKDGEINIYTDSNVFLYSTKLEKDNTNIKYGFIQDENGWYDFTKQHLIKHKEYKSLFDTNQIVFFDNHDVCYIYINEFCRLLEADINDILYISLDGDIVYIRKNNQFYYAHYSQAGAHYDIEPIVLTNFDSSRYSNALFTDTENVILCKEENQYVLYNIQQGTKEAFDNTNFVIKGLNGYQPIISFDRYKRPILKDPVTLCPATPEILSKEYAFVSPSGRYRTLFSRKFKNKILGKIVNEKEKLDFLSEFSSEYKIDNISDEEIKSQHITNRQRFVDDHKELFKSYFISCVKEDDGRKYICECMSDDKFAQYLFNEIISILDSQASQEIKIEIIGVLWFKNYVSFSYDDKYVAIAGRYPNNTQWGGGYFGIYDLEKGEMIRSITSYKDRMLDAIWITAFTKDGKVAFYDSDPNTYVFNPHLANAIQEIKGKNFLCYSADGKYMALSEQGYRCYDEKLPYSDWGHTKSTTVYIYNVENIELIETIHCKFGSQIAGVARRAGNVAYVAFSQDNTSILISSDDGVVLVYNLNL